MVCTVHGVQNSRFSNRKGDLPLSGVLELENFSYGCSLFLFLGPGGQPKVGILDLYLAMFMVCLSVSLSVCHWSRGCIVAKRLDRSRCHLACGVRWGGPQ